MSKQDVQDEIIAPMQRAFLPPRNMEDTELNAAIREYADALEGFSKEDLRTAWVRTRNTHRKRAWPLIADFYAEAERARSERTLASEGDTRAKMKATDKGKENWRTWERVRNSDLGKQAAAAGVAWALKCAILSGTAVANISIPRLVQDKGRAAILADRLESGTPYFHPQIGREVTMPPGPNRVLLLDMWHGLLVQEAETVKEIGYTGEIAQPDLEPLAF